MQVMASAKEAEAIAENKKARVSFLVMISERALKGDVRVLFLAVADVLALFAILDVLHAFPVTLFGIEFRVGQPEGGGQPEEQQCSSFFPDS
ncbi:hypothetical protein LZ017_04875 [Pelomonas sp. CA6]|uniref:hypothetical protein n=1 Tax=Pelomonas sp. CA6 TaxID=2907999 RepID=UPI001F4A6264|nr:hypothetical protein [Pelomonas sp. CA6]MCH7342711.1 hypothetical protein [Pelomonas sp. CA6]